MEIAMFSSAAVRMGSEKEREGNRNVQRPGGGVVSTREDESAKTTELD